MINILKRFGNWVPIYLARLYITTRDEALTRLIGAYRPIICIALFYVYLIFPPAYYRIVVQLLLLIYFIYSLFLLRLSNVLYNNTNFRKLRIGIDILFISLLLIFLHRPQSDVCFLYGIPIFTAYLYFSLSMSIIAFMISSLIYAVILISFNMSGATILTYINIFHIWLGRTFMLSLIPLIMLYHDRRKKFKRETLEEEKERRKSLGRLLFTLPNYDLVNIFYNRSKFLDLMLEVTSTALDSPTLGFFAYDKITNRLILVAARGYDDRAIGKAYYAMGQGVTGWIAKERKRSILIENLFDESRFEGTHRSFIHPYASNKTELGKLFDKISFIGVCLESGGEFIGVLTASRPHRIGEKITGFDEEDVKVLRALGDQIEMAYENAAHLNELHRITEIMKDVNSSANLNKIFEEVLDAVSKLLPVKSCDILQAQDDGSLKIVAVKCFDPNVEMEHFEKGKTIKEESFNWKVYKLKDEDELDIEKERNNYTEEQWQASDRMGIKYLFSILLRPPEGEKFGVLSIGSEDSLNEMDRYIARLLAGQASAAIGLAQKRINEIEKFSALAEECITKVSVKDICDKVLGAALEFTNCKNGEILLLNPALGDIKTIVAKGYIIESLTEDKPRRIAVNDKRGFIRKSARTGEIQLFQDKLIENTQYIPSFPGSPTQSQFCIPLQGSEEQRIIGVLNLESEDEKHFTDDHKLIIKLLCKCVSPIIYKTQKQEQFSEFYTLVKELAFVRDKETLIKSCIDKIPSILRVPICGIFLWDEKEQKYILQAGVGFPKEAIGKEGYKKGEGRTGEIINKCDPRVYNFETTCGKFLKYHKEFLKGIPAVAFMGAPIKSRNGKAIGAIDITRPRYSENDSNGFTNDNKQLLELFADLISVALENIETIQKIVIVEEEKVNIISKMASAAAHTIRNPLWVSIQWLKNFYNDLDINDTNRSGLEIVMREIEKVEDVIKGFRNLLIDHPLRLELIDPLIPLKKMIHFCEPIFKKENIVIENNIQFSHTILGDQDALSKVFFNIIRNSVEAMHRKGGKITFLNYESENQEKVIIKIKDTGVGIPIDKINDVFIPHYTTKFGDNTGLGLTICKDTIEKHNGVLLINSELNKGTEITIILPIRRKI